MKVNQLVFQRGKIQSWSARHQIGVITQMAEWGYSIRLENHLVDANSSFNEVV
jgi:hypothetical protein